MKAVLQNIINVMVYSMVNGLAGIKMAIRLKKVSTKMEREVASGMVGIVPAKRTSAVLTRMASVQVIMLSGTLKGKRLKRFTTVRVKELKNIW